MIGVLLTVIWSVLFVGMLLAGYFTIRQREQERAPQPSPLELESPAFFARPYQARTPEDIVVRQIEHHLREEWMVANRFVDSPSVLTLWAGHSLTSNSLS